VAAPRLVFAELQTAGRGRRGRDWLAPFGSGLTFSIGWTFAEMPADLSALSLALGVCVVRALRSMGATDTQLKWPNDIVYRHHKLGGLLLQMRSEAGGPAYVVAGLGLNLELPAAVQETLRAAPLATPPTDLAAACGGVAPSRVVVAARLAGTMLDGLATFARSGFAPFAADWSAFDSLRDAPVTVLRHDGQLEGTARGTDREGALLVEVAGGLQKVHAGDVSLRRTARTATH
jgi:BirA family biotin operon repressor/biotin-[acetyl-CoA-carboxylase] ligase